MLRFGIISELGEGENIGFARVSFDESDLVSAWLPLPSTNTQNTKLWVPVAVNSQVACIMDENCEQGIISMVLWSETDTPPEWANENTYGILFSDGTEIIYNTEESKLDVNAPDAELNFTCKKLNITGEVNIEGDTNITGEVGIEGNTTIEGDTKIKGDTDVDGDITATKDVTAGPMNIALTKHKHPTPAGVSGTPTP
ncbi:phage baseplate assembly protein V [Paludibacteraceae bacterium OttesenSCG-928-F17]|nr:phage baseplate assembly protein V [Paludibacteraceae bacterium OttesenSCG-928-F17]